MAASQEFPSSACSTYSSEKNENNSDQSDGVSPRSNLLVVRGSEFFWKGNLTELKHFTDCVLHLTGRWSSPGGEVKCFSNEKIVLKWHGPTRKKITIIKDENEELTNAIQKHAHEEIQANDNRIVNTAIHHVDAAILLPLPSPTCDKCGKHELELDQTEIEQKFGMILARLGQLEEKQHLDETSAMSRASELEATIEALKIENKKMADDLEKQQSTIDEITQDNSMLSQILEVKQHQWIEVEGKNSSNKAKTRLHQNVVHDSLPPRTSNRFSVLDVEDSSNETQSQDNTTMNTDLNDFNTQINNYRLKKKRDRKGMKAQETDSKTNEKSKNGSKVLVLGDSMVKNIDNSKISRAAREQSCCHSYRGATVDQLQEKFKEDCCGADDEGSYETIILHVGTNNLTNEDPEDVATKMESLIQDAKNQAKNVAVSSVVNRYDGRVPPNHITTFNGLLHDLCLRQQVTFIDNSIIKKSLLNRSNLHLNKNGDRVLGKAFCEYLRSLRLASSNPAPNEHFLWLRPSPSGERREWMKYLEHVSRVTRL